MLTREFSKDVSTLGVSGDLSQHPELPERLLVCTDGSALQRGLLKIVLKRSLYPSAQVLFKLKALQLSKVQHFSSFSLLFSKYGPSVQYTHN